MTIHGTIKRFYHNTELMRGIFQYHGFDATAKSAHDAGDPSTGALENSVDFGALLVPEMVELDPPIDFLTVPTMTFRKLYVLVVLSLDRRRIVHLNVTTHPTAEWTALQLGQAFMFDTAQGQAGRLTFGPAVRDIQGVSVGTAGFGRRMAL